MPVTQPSNDTTVQRTAAPVAVLWTDDDATGRYPVRSVLGRIGRVGRRSASWIGVVALTMSGAAAGLVTGATAAADPIGNCTTTAGVIVVVDFTAWGGNIERGCDATLTTGYDALYAAGFTTADDAQDGPSFICRIDNEPPPAQDACITTPPADAYWSYWHADAGADTWSYSPVGAMSYHPPPGSVDAWTFGATDIDGTDGQPTFAPSAVRATNTSVTSPSSTTIPVVTSTTAAPGPSSPPKTAGGGGPPPASTRPSPSPPTTTGDGGRGQPSVTTTTPPTPTTTTTSGRVGPTRRGGKPSPRIVDAAPAVINRGSGGSPLSIVVGVGVAAGLAGCAALVARRRRRTG